MSVNQEVNIDPSDVVLTNCGICIDARDNATVTLSTPGTLRCDAFEHGIRTQDNAQVTLGADEDIIIDAAEDGIRAENIARVNVAAEDDVNIEAVKDGIRAEGAAQVDVTSLDCSISGGESALSTEGTAILSVPAACSLVSGLPDDGEDDGEDDLLTDHRRIRCEGNESNG